MKLLWNTVGAVATTNTVTGGTVISSHNAEYLFYGDRSKVTRTDSQAGDVSFGYEVSSGSFSWDHMVVTNADRTANNKTTSAIKVEQDVGAGYVTVSGSTVAPFQNSDLVGIDLWGIGHGQDYVFTPASEQTGVEGVRFVTYKNSGGDDMAREVGKVFFCDSFDFGTEPLIDPEPEWEDIPESDKIFKPRQGYVSYPTTKRTTLTWKHLSSATVTSFLAIDNLLAWPLFLYDSSQYLFQHKLEHVIIERISEKCEPNAIANQNIELEITFRRLKHYRGAA